MPPPTFSPSRNAILLIAVVEREYSLHIKHTTSPNLPSQHPAVVAAHTALIQAPDFIFPSDIPPSDIIPQSSKPPQQSQPTTTAPQQLPLSSSAVYHALSEPSSDSDPPFFKLPRPSLSSHRRASRTFSNLSSANTNLPTAPAALRRPTSSPPPRKSSLDLPPFAAPSDLELLPSPSSPDPNVSDNESCRSSIESRHRQFRAILFSVPTHAFAITAQDGSRQYVFCRPLSSAHAVVVVSSLSHTALYVSALERTAATYAELVEDALSNPTAHAYPTRNPSNPRCVCSSFVADNIMRCPPDIAKKLAEAMLTYASNCPLAVSKDHVPFDVEPSRSSSYIALFKQLKNQADAHDPATDVENNSGPCLTSSTASSMISRSETRTPRESLYPISVSDNWEQRESYSFWNTEPSASSGVTNSDMDQSSERFPWEVAMDSPNTRSLSAERAIELADASLLLRHFSVRNLVSIVVALLEERRVCFVGPNTAVVSRAVLALDNLVRPFKWPHLISPILLPHILPVLGAPFPYLVGILDGHFPATKELPLDDVLFADMSSGKITTVEGPGELYRHIPRRIRIRFERRLARAKIACARKILRSRSMLFSPGATNTAASMTEVEDHEEYTKKEKASLLKRSRSFVRINEGCPQHVWLDHDTSAIIDKAIRKFFAELLEGFIHVRDIDNYIKIDGESRPDGFNQFLSQTSSSTVVSLGSSKRDPEKYQLAMSFQRTQMFMQWRDEVECDPSFGAGPSEAESQRGSVSRKRSKDRDISSQGRKATADADEDLIMKSPKFKIRLTSDVEDIFSGDDGLTGESGAVRKRFRGKRKLGRRQGGRLYCSTEVVKTDVPIQGEISNTGNSLKPTELLSAIGMNVSADHITNEDIEAHLENGVPSRRPWLSLRLPSSPWTTARERATFSGREGDTESEACDQSDEGEETDPFDEPEEGVDITDMFPTENVGTGWTRMRQWSRRKNRQSARV